MLRPGKHWLCSGFGFVPYCSAAAIADTSSSGVDDERTGLTPASAHFPPNPAGTYLEGAVVTLAVKLTAFHKGRFGFRICRFEGNTTTAENAAMSEACLDSNILTQADVDEAQAPGDAYYHLGSTSASDYTMYYQLPSGLTCDGTSAKCVLQWYYLTGNSCNPPDEPEKYISSALGTCGAGGYPEEVRTVGARGAAAGLMWMAVKSSTPPPPAPT